MKKGFLNSIKSLPVAIVCLVFIMISAYILVGKYKNPLLPTTNWITVADSSRYIENIFDKVDAETDILYAEVVNYNDEKEKLLLDVYMPSGDKKTNRPAIIWIHGGGFTNGSKDSGMEKDLAIDFAKKGYVTLNINYRLRENAESLDVLKDAVDDAAAALKWLILNSEAYGVDKTKIAIGGFSAGGGIAINLCYSDIKAYGIDKSNIFATINLAGGKLYMGGVRKEDPPCISIHGTNDNKVPYSNSEQLANDLNKKGIDNTLYPILGSDHDIASSYDAIINEVTRFLYKTLTGNAVTNTINEGKSYDYIKVEERLVSGKSYTVKQIDLKVDGKLDEWGNSEIMTLDELKDVGTYLPDKEDFSGTAMIAWNEQDPTRIYISAIITDDIIEDTNSAKTNWFRDDCLEIAFDLSNNGIPSPITKWVIGATGIDLSAFASNKNTEYKIVKQGDIYTYEMAIDITKPKSAVPDVNKTFKIKAGDTIALSLSYNECENNTREHQIGWVAGKASDRANFGNLNFVAEKIK